MSDETQISEETRLDASILIVDDEPANVLLLQRILKRAGYRQLSSAADGHAAVEMCRQSVPDLILLDLMMPRLDGFGVMENIAPLLEGQYLPILVLTADVSATARERALSVGAKDFLTKPFNQTEVVCACKNLLETRLFNSQTAPAKRATEIRVAQTHRAN
jgi:CheY-like chemotaxis protein